MRCGRSRPYGLSLLEFTLIVILFSVLVVVAVERIISLRVDIERAGVEHTVGAMRGALALEFARLTVRGDREAIRAWAGGNALELIEVRGILDGGDVADAESIGPGQWSWQADRGEIVYRLAWPEAAAPGSDTGRWRVVVRGENGPTGLDLEAVEAIEWR